MRPVYCLSILFAWLFIAIHASPIVLNPDLLPQPTIDKRDVVELHNTGDKTKTATATATATSRPKSTPSVAASSSPEAIYGGSGITPQNGIAGAFLIVLGLYLMVFGFRSFRMTLGVCGFITFAFITWVAMINNQPFYGYVNNNITILAVPAGLGILGAIIYSLFWNISLYLVGALGGLSLALYIMCCKANLVITSVVARAALLVALPFFMSFLLFFAERYVLLFTFAFTGAFCFIVGVEFLAHTGYLAGLKSILDGNKYHPVIYTITRNVIVLIVMISVLFLISFGWQYMFNSGMKFGVNFKEEEKKPKKDKKKDKKDKKDDGPGEPGKIDHSQPTVEAQDKEMTFQSTETTKVNVHQG